MRNRNPRQEDSHRRGTLERVFCSVSTTVPFCAASSLPFILNLDVFVSFRGFAVAGISSLVLLFFHRRFFLRKHNATALFFFIDRLSN